MNDVETTGERSWALGMTGTKLAIFRAAVDLFYERGTEHVGLRDIAEAVGIKSASFYNHFESKNALIEQMSHFFFQNYRSQIADLDSIFELIPHTPPHEIIDKLQLPTGPGPVHVIMKKIMRICEFECCHDQRAKDILSFVFALTSDRITKVLDEMIRVGVIKPINSDLFASVLTRFTLSAASHIDDMHNMSISEWRAGCRLLFSLVENPQYPHKKQANKR